jgi:methionyl aminopeptidase
LESWELRPGVVIAIEPMITLGSWKVKTLPDEWTVVTADHSLSAHFEHTIVITDSDPIVVTRRPSEGKK